MDKHVMIGSSAESPMSPFGRPGFGRSQLEHSTRLREVVLMLAVEYGAKSKIHRKMDDMLPFFEPYSNLSYVDQLLSIF